MEKAENNKVIVLFDGVCNMCNGFINNLIDRDRKSILRFASLQSDIAKGALRNFGIDNNTLTSILVIKNDKLYSNSRAILEICRSLGGIYKLLYIFIIIPSFIRDFFYKIVAKNRYKWFGISDSCRIPTENLKKHFL